MNLNSLDRRRFLRGTGVALALPLFECVASSRLQASEDTKWDVWLGIAQSSGARHIVIIFIWS